MPEKLNAFENNAFLPKKSIANLLQASYSSDTRVD
jgi:hypothetical protein